MLLDSPDACRLDGEPGEAAIALDRRLYTLSHSHTQLRRVIGRGLDRLSACDGFIKLGYSTLGGYVDEALGIGARQAEELAWMERNLRERPGMSVAYDEGTISFSAMRILLRTIPVEVEAAWADIAKDKTVEELKAALDDWKRLTAGLFEAPAARPKEASAEPPTLLPAEHRPLLSHGHPTAHSAQVGAPAGSSPTTAPEPLSDRVGVCATPARETPSSEQPFVPDSMSRGVPLHVPEGDDEAPRGRWIAFSAPPSLAARWYVGLELARRMAGSDISAASAVEMFIGEFMSGEGGAALSAALRKRDTIGPRSSMARYAEGSLHATSSTAPTDATPSHTDELNAPDPKADVPWHLQFMREMRAYWRDVERDIDTMHERWLNLSWEIPAVRVPSDLEPHPEDDSFDLDRRLCEAARLTRRVDGHLRRLLTLFASGRLYLHLDFVSLEHYARERLRMSVSKAHELVSLQRRLRGRNHLAETVDNGDISHTQAKLLIKIVEPKSEIAWVSHALQTTVRFLKEDVDAALRLRDHDQETYERTFGVPVPRRPVPTTDETRAKRTDAQALQRYAAASAQALLNAGLQTCAPTSAEAADRSTCADLQTCAPEANEEAESASCCLQTCAQAERSALTGGRLARAPLPLRTFRTELRCILEELRGDADCYDDSRRRVPIRFWLPEELFEVWEEACGACRIVLGSPAGPADCIEIMVEAFLAAYGEEALDLIRRHPILERHAWKCAVPTCGRRAALHVHHLVFRSLGGGNEPWLKVALCAVHHLHGVHEKTIRVTGTAPRDLVWELGVRPDKNPLLVVVDRRVVPQPARSASAVRADRAVAV